MLSAGEETMVFLPSLRLKISLLTHSFKFLSKYLSIASLCNSLFGIRVRTVLIIHKASPLGACSLVGRDW